MWIHDVCLCHSFCQCINLISPSVCSAGLYSVEGAVNLALNKPTLDSSEYSTCRSAMAVDGSRYLGPGRYR